MNRPRSPRRFRILAASFGLLAGVAGGALAQDLTRVVPAEAFMITHEMADPSLAFADAYEREMLQAVKDAKFDEIILDTLSASGLPDDQTADLRKLRDIVSHLVGRVDWDALTRNESVFAMDMRPPLPWLPMVGMPSMLLAFKPDAAEVDKLEQALGNLMATIAAIAPEDLKFDSETNRESGARTYNIRVRDWNDLAVVQLGVMGSEVVLGVGESFFRSAVQRLEGRGGASLVDSPRFAQAFGELSMNHSRYSYVDVARLIDDIEAQAMPYIPEMDMARSIARDVFELSRVVETVASTTHAQGYELVEESWVRFDQRAIDSGNPLFLACCKPETGESLLGYIPAEAQSFSYYRGADLGPLYRYLLDRYEEYAPRHEAEQNLVMWNAGQAILDLDFERDILSLLGSDSVNITLPSDAGNPMQPQDYVTLVQLENPEAARSLLRRFENTYDAAVPWLLEKLAEEQSTTIPFTLKLSDARAPFPGLKRMTMSMRWPGLSFPMPDTIYGMVGDKLVITSSVDALMHVMMVGADEAPGLEEHPAVAGTGRLTREPVLNATYTPYAEMMKSVREAASLGIGSMMMAMNAAVSGNKHSKPEAKAMVKGFSSLFPKMIGLISQYDFVDDGVSYTQAREEGRALYARNSIQYFSPEQRARYRGR